MRDNDEIQIRSYRVVFDFERRLHRIDRWRLPLPYGLPLRGLAYAVVALAAVLFCSGLPLVGAMLGVLPTPARLVLLPVAAAYALTRCNLDGRPAHRTGLAVLRMYLTAGRSTPGRRIPAAGTVVRFDAVTIAPDARGASLRPGTVRGQAVAWLRFPAELVRSGRRLRVQPTGGTSLDPGVRIAFDASRRLVIR